MSASRFASATIVIVLCVSYSSTGWAQQAAGIAGVVRDTTGAVIPGVTVEAASPALIEKVRTVVTDGDGRYNVVDLRPGVYSVTFTLAGFNTFRREGVELTTGFTASVNADLRVGALEETVTVTGASPLVDTQNVRQQTVISDDLVNSLPTATMAISNLATLTPGLTSTNASNVGGATGSYGSSSIVSASFHGKTGGETLYDGMSINNMVRPGATAIIVSPATLEEWTVETGGGLAESSAATSVVVNAIPKEGSNRFSGSFSALFSNDGLQSNNLTDELRARGLTTVNKVHYIYNVDGAVGGPIKRDKLWYFIAQRVTGNKNAVAGVFFNETQGTPFFTPDQDRPGFRRDLLRSHAARFTWQASSKNKVSFFADVQHHCVCRGRGEFEAAEVAYKWLFWPTGLYQASWNSPVTNRLLLEAGASAMIYNWPTLAQPEVGPSDIAILEQSTSFWYNARPSGNINGLGDKKDADRFSQRFALSYVTGSHAFKTGIGIEEGVYNVRFQANGDSAYRFLRGVPNQITQYATPFTLQQRLRADLGVFAQDQWRIQRMTLNLGLRFEYLNAYVPEQHEDGGTWIGARDYAALHSVPSWTDVNPRMGVSYDFFGNGRTALKVAFGRYVTAIGTNLAELNNPLVTSVNTVNRTWIDSNQNYVADCNLRDPASNGECGAFDNQNFGQSRITTRYADDVLRGFGTRENLWDLSTEVQQQLGPAISVTAGYYRNWYGNFLATDNLEVTPADFSPYCITAPVDSRLPGGGGNQICGLYDVAPARFGRVNNLVTKASEFGDQKRVNDFFAINLRTRFQSGAQLGGGFDTGRSVTDNCFVVDSPMQLRYSSVTDWPPAAGARPAGTPIDCHIETPFSAQTQVKLYGSYPLPGEFAVSAVFQNTSGPTINANFPATNAMIAPTLGRNLAAGANATATVPLIPTQTMFTGRATQLDLRLSKRLRFGSRMRLDANLDAYNILNASSVISVVSTYGPLWTQPAGLNAILEGRLLQFGGRLSF